MESIWLEIKVIHLIYQEECQLDGKQESFLQGLMFQQNNLVKGVLIKVFILISQ